MRVAAFALALLLTSGAAAAGPISSFFGGYEAPEPPVGGDCGAIHARLARERALHARLAPEAWGPWTDPEPILTEERPGESNTLIFVEDLVPSVVPG